MRRFRQSGLGCLALAACLLLSSCWTGGANQVVVYSALDREFADPILTDFQTISGIRVLAKFDVESTKTVGLTQAIMAESRRPRCDVFWNNEILNTLRLRERGLLDAYLPPVAANYPELFRADDGTWHGFAARARILIVNTRLVTHEERPSSIEDLTDPKWKGKAAIAKPLFGTTATHGACLFSVWGDERAKEFFRRLKGNGIRVLGGNKQVAQAVASGEIAFGLTDTDDAIIELENGQSVALVYPDREDEQLGTLFIPNTLAIIKGCPHPRAARQLIDHLLSPDVERRLALGVSAQIPLGPDVDIQPRVETPRTVKAMPVDFADAAEKWDAAARFLRDEFGAE